MSPATSDPSLIPSQPSSESARSVPTLNELYEWTAEPDHRVVIRGVSWAFYEQLVDSISEGANLHVDYDGKDLEVMGKGRKHERISELLGYLVRIVTEELETPYESLGETTWKRPKLARGIEADQCYYFQAGKLEADAAALARDSDDIADYPNPDLAIEVDISPPLTDRASIYAALGVIELWRFTTGQVVIERLVDDGTYRAVDASAFLPLRADEIRRWVVDEDSRNKPAWAQRLRAWVKGDLVHRLPH
ncbi:MAG: Uma2 family endonuclease [Isosphaeraceae bacterium]